jgi:hypothetical protein
MRSIRPVRPPALIALAALAIIIVAGALSTLGVTGEAAGALPGLLFAMAGLCLFLGAAALFVIRRWRTGAGLLAALSVVSAVGLFAPGSSTHAAGEFTVSVSPAAASASSDIALWDATYGDSKQALQDLSTNAGTARLVFATNTTVLLPGLPSITGTANTGVANFDDANRDLTVMFDATLYSQAAKVLVSASWVNDSDTEPELAVVVRFEQIGLSAINSSWTLFPVNFEKALVGFANTDQTLEPSATLGTGTFFDDGVAGDDSFHILPGGAGLQAVLRDATGDDPLIEGASVLGGISAVVIRGTAASSGFDLSATFGVTTPAALVAKGIDLDTGWSVQLSRDSGGTFSAGFSGGLSVDLGGQAVDISASLAINYSAGATTFTLEGSVSAVNDLLSQSWLDLTNLDLTAEISRDTSTTPATTTVSASLTAGLTLGPVSATASISITKDSSGSEFTLALSATGGVDIGDVLTAVGAPAINAGLDVSLSNFSVFVTANKPTASPATVTFAATGGATILARTCGSTVYPGGAANLLFRLQTGGGLPSTFFVGAGLTGLNVKNLSCDIPFNWSLPDLLVLAGNSEVNTLWGNVDGPTQNFFEMFYCGQTGDNCDELQGFTCLPTVVAPCLAAQQSLRVAQGLNIRALVEFDADMEAALEEIGIVVEGPLVMSGTVPVFGGTATALKVSLPAITSGDPDSIVSGGTVSFEIESTGTSIAASITGGLDFRVARPDQSTCDNVIFSGQFSDGDCYDTLSLSVSVEVSAGTDGVELALTGTVSNWVQAFGEPNLTITTFAIELSVSAGPTGVTLGLGMRGDLVIGTTDLQIAFLVEVGGPPPRIMLKGLTVGTSQGISLRDIVEAFAPDLDSEAVPAELSLKNLWFAYGIETNATLCIRQGLFISAELHLNADSTATGTNPACGGAGVPTPVCDGTTSCLAAIQVDITPNRFKLYGAITGFDMGPLSFGGAELLIDLTLVKQEIYFKGSATLYDPIAYYAADPDGTETVWASGYLKIEVSQNAGVFSLALTGCALIGGDAVADEDCEGSGSTLLLAYIDGSIEADFTKTGMEFFESASVEFEVSLSSPALEQLMEDLEEELEPAINWLEDTAELIEGTATEVISDVEDQFCVSFNPDCDELQVTASAYTDAPSYIAAVIAATDKAIDESAAVGFYCFGIGDWPVDDCVDDFRDDATAANNAAVAAAGGAARISLWGIDRQGYGGIKDADFDDVWYVNPTYFKWPSPGPALCAAGGAFQGLSICGATPNADDLIDEVILYHLQQTDPTLAALLADGSLSAPQRAAAMVADQTSGVFLANIRELAATFDMAKPLSVCEATATYGFTPAGALGVPAFDGKVDAHGGLSMPAINIVKGKVDTRSLRLVVLRDVLNDAVTNLDCPKAAPAASLSFQMSASAINEGGAVTLTGKGPAGALVTIEWKDGSANSTATVAANGAWTASHTFADGPAVRSIKASAAGGLQASAILTVNNVAPSISAVTAPEVNEGSTATVSGSFTDPGTLDTHTVTVTWGDGTTSTRELAANVLNFSLSRTIVDDNPTGTSEDTYAIQVTVTDKDKGKDSEASSLLVRNVAPNTMLLASATWAGGSATPDAAGNLSVPEGVAVTVTGSFRDPGRADTHTVYVQWAGKFLSGVATRSGADPDVLNFTVTQTFADDHPATGTPSDVVSFKVQVRDDDRGAVDSSQSTAITDVAPVLTVSPATQSTQYSDPIGAITLTASDVVGVILAAGTSESLTASTRWKVGTGAFQAGLPSNLALTPGACSVVSDEGTPRARQSCSWTVTGIANVAPGAYTIEFAVVDDDTVASVSTAEITVQPEDARADYLGPTVASAPSVLSGSITVELRAIVRDSSVVPGIVPADTNPGNITNATVTFVNRATGAVLCTAGNAKPMYTGNTTTGVATCMATIPTTGSATSWQVQVGTVVGGWYIRDSAADNVTLVINKPNGDKIHGNHIVSATSPAGTTAPTANQPVRGSINNAGYNGNFTAISTDIAVEFNSGGRTYRAVVTTVDSLGILRSTAPGVNKIEVEATATLYDVTGNPKNPPVTATAVRLQLRYFDFHAPSTPDTMAFTLWDPSGMLIAAAHWDTVRLQGQTLTDGQIMVK